MVFRGSVRPQSESRIWREAPLGRMGSDDAGQSRFIKFTFYSYENIIDGVEYVKGLNG